MKKKIILIAIIVIAAALFICFYKYAGSMVSQDVKNVESIIISMYPYDTNKTVIEDDGEINKIFNMLMQTSEIKNNRHPQHSESVEHDPKFTMDIQYKDGKTDSLFASPRENYIGLYLNTKGSSGDSGYRTGKNQMIWEYILK